MKKVLGIYVVVAVLAVSFVSAQETIKKAGQQSQDQYKMVLRVASAKTLKFNLSPFQKQKLGQVTQYLKSGDTNAALNNWKQLVVDMAGKNTATLDSVNIQALINYVLRESYLEPNADLQFYADKVKYFNAQKKAVRDHLTELRELQAGIEISETSGPVSVDKLVLKPFQPSTTPGGQVPTEEHTESEPFEILGGEVDISGLEELEEMMEEYEEILQTVGEDAQLANIDLQSQLQKSQQTIQLMNNVSKMLHDTLLSELRKIG